LSTAQALLILMDIIYLILSNRPSSMADA